MNYINFSIMLGIYILIVLILAILVGYKAKEVEGRFSIVMIIISIILIGLLISFGLYRFVIQN